MREKKNLSKFVVTLAVDAAVIVKVSATDEQEAADKAFELAKRPSLCPHCSGHLDLGDFTGDAYVDMEQ